MSTSPNILVPNPIAPEVFTDAAAAVERIEEIHERDTKFPCDRFEACANGEPFEARVFLRHWTPSDRPHRDVFDSPDLATIDDATISGPLKFRPGAPTPLALFRAERIDYSPHWLNAYRGAHE